MKTIAINVDGVLRDFHAQFDKMYRKVFVHNASLVEMNEDFTVREQSEEEIEAEKTKIKSAIEKVISYPIDTYDLLNHYEFRPEIFKMTGKEIKTDAKYGAESTGITIMEDQNDITFTPKDSLDNFLYQNFPFQIFGDAEEYEGAVAIVNKIQRFGLMNNLFDVVLVSSVKSAAIPSTFHFLSKTHSRVRKVLFLDNEEQKWEHCDILIDATPDALQLKPKDKTSIKINRPFNQHYQGDHNFSSIKEVYDEEFLRKILND